MNIESLEKRIAELESEIPSLYSGIERYKIYDFFDQIKELLEFRKVKPFIEISEDGHSFRCPTCLEHMVTDEDITYDEFEFCPLCGQRVSENVYIREKEYGQEDIRST